MKETTIENIYTLEADFDQEIITSIDEGRYGKEFSQDTDVKITWWKEEATCPPLPEYFEFDSEEDIKEGIARW